MPTVEFTENETSTLEKLLWGKRLDGVDISTLYTLKRKVEIAIAPQRNHENRNIMNYEAIENKD